MTTASPAPTLSVRRITKNFGSTQVLRGIDLEVAGGEFVGLMGPNGAGKSTLIKILDGIYATTSGSILVDGFPVASLRDTGDVGFVHQDLGLVDALTVVDNLRLGEVPLRLFGPLLDKRAEQAAAREALSLVGLDVPLTAPVGQLSPAEKTLLAVARTFARGASILFVDEATSTLPPRDATRVITALAAAVKTGKTVIMVSHKLNEILDGTTRVVLLLDGRIAADRPTAGLDRPALVDLLYRHESAKALESSGGAPARVVSNHDAPVELEMVAVRHVVVGPVDLTVHGGEVVGLTGSTGSGLHEVALLAAGAVRPSAGVVRRRQEKVGLVPPHRETQGGFVDLAVSHNLTISALARWRRRRSRLLAGRRLMSDANAMAERLSVLPRDVKHDFGALSGGNKQKVVFGRALLDEPGLYVLCEPTRGVDVATRNAIYSLIHELQAHGSAVLVVSSDTEDLLAVCDRVAVVADGRLGTVRPLTEMTSTEIEALL